ncbi:MAG: rhodanese-like domain-containing protein [Propionibacteriaceae bacterium]|nr:rhodanese-like domain-containing protein [Propionibacteriaceae bacterium]
MTATISLAEFISRYHDGAMLIDVREPDEYAAGHVPGAILAPMSSIEDHLADIPRGEDVFVICHSGRRSLATVSLMRCHGIRAISVDEGTAGWIAAGQTVVREEPTA